MSVESRNFRRMTIIVRLARKDDMQDVLDMIQVCTFDGFCRAVGDINSTEIVPTAC